MNARVSEEYIRCIRRAHAAGKTIPELCGMFPKLKEWSIRSIVNRQSWRHVA